MRRFWLSVVAIVLLGACGGGTEPEGNAGGTRAARTARRRPRPATEAAGVRPATS